MTAEMKNPITITINGKPVTCDKGDSLIEVIRGSKFDVPSFCNYPGLRVTANCRMCLVQIKGQKKPVPSCNTAAVADMVIETDTPEIHGLRKTMLELILMNHPLDCPVCDKDGECELQDSVMKYGPSSSPFEGRKRVFKPADTGDKIWKDMDRCIRCRRCDLFMQEVVGDTTWSILNRGAATERGPADGKPIQGDMVGNLADICPVGALVDKQYWVTDRVWKLTKVSASRKCSRCCGKAVLWLNKEKKVRRITARTENRVVVEWICDQCRYEKKELKHWKLEKAEHHVSH